MRIFLIDNVFRRGTFRTFTVLLFMFTGIYVWANNDMDGVKIATAKVSEYIQENAKNALRKSRSINPVIKCIATKNIGEKFQMEMHLFSADIVSGNIIVVTNSHGGADIIGITDSIVEDLDNMPLQLRYYLDNLNELADDTRPTCWDRINPLLTTKWNQIEPYNRYTPEIKGTKAPTGCVATAMAQIMRFHCWPEIGIGSSTLSDYNLTANFNNTIYKWDDMPDVLTSISTEEQISAVSTLMMHCGVASKMKYRSNESTASLSNAMKGLREYFNYLGVYTGCSGYSRQDWNALMYNELQNHRPVLYSGSTPGYTGHAFVCDGYDDNFFHINWGWGGHYDGYFKLSYLVPSGVGTGGGNGNYSDDQRVLIGLEPNKAETIPALYPLISNFTFNLGSEGMYIPVPQFQYSAEVPFDVEYGLCITPVDGNGESWTESIWSKKGVISSSFPSMSSVVLSPKIFPKNGVFHIQPKARVIGRTEWTGVPVTNGSNYIVVTMTDGNMSLSKDADADASFKVLGIRHTLKAYSDKPFSVIADFKGEGNVLKKNITLYYRKKGDNVKYSVSSFNLELNDGEIYSQSFNVIIPKAGEYELFIGMYSNGITEEYGNTDVVVNEYTTPEIALYSRVYVENEYNVDLNNIRLHIPLECKSGTFSENIQISLWSETETRFPLFDAGIIQLEAGESKDIIVDMSIDSEETFFGGNVYIFRNNTLFPIDNRGASSFTFGRAATYISLTDNSTFSDAGFRSALAVADIDSDKRLSNVECRKTTSLTLKGDIYVINALSSFPNLTNLIYEDGALERIDLEGASNLVNLRLDNNNLSEIDLSQSPKLMYLSLNKNKLSKIDFSVCPQLMSVNLDNNNISTIDCSMNVKLSSLSARYNPNLDMFISGEANSIKYLYASHCALKEINLANYVNLSTLDIGYNNLNGLDLTAQTKLQWLSCEHNELINLDVHKANITYLDCSNNKLKEFNAGGFANLVTLNCSNNQLCYIDLSYTKKLLNFYCYNNVRYFEPCSEFWLNTLNLKFNISNAYNWTGAEPTQYGGVLTIKDEKVTYRYNVNNAKFEAPQFTWYFTGNSSVSEAMEDLEDAEVEYYNLQGIRINTPQAPGIYIRKRGKNVDKIFKNGIR